MRTLGRTGIVVVVAGCALFSAGCFALFSLDDYGPVDDPLLLSNDGGDGDVVVASDVVVVDAPPQPTPLAGRVVFITSTTHDGSFGGTGQADKMCQDLAAAAGLSGTFKAWVSDMQSTPRQRFARITTLPDAGPGDRLITADRQTIIAAGFTELAQQGPRVAIAMTEKKELLPAPALSEVMCQQQGAPTPSLEVVWTGTAQDGDRIGQDCGRWLANGPAAEGMAGALVSPDGGKDPNSTRDWTQACSLPCTVKAHFYCFEQ